MKIKVIALGKTSEPYLKTGLADYQKRLKPFVNIEWLELDNSKIKSKNRLDILKKERELVMKSIKKDDKIFLLDEKGKQYTSENFSHFLQQNMNQSLKSLIFIIGGGYGFDKEMHGYASGKISFSNMTFTHQMIRLFFAEQLYRAYSIINNQPYHHV